MLLKSANYSLVKRSINIGRPHHLGSSNELLLIASAHRRVSTENGEIRGFDVLQTAGLE
jgi:hypothetical protein